MIEKLEIKHLKTLSALYKIGNMSMVAEQLNLSQQAVSLQLSKIRGILNDELFVRSGHGMVPTPYAKQLEPFVQKILNSFNDIPLADSMNPETLERIVVISATDYTQKVIISELIETFRISAPNVKFFIIDIESASLTQKMLQGEIDIAFTTSAFVPLGLVSEPLFVENYRPVTANKTIVGDQELSPEELVGYDFIITNPGVPSLKGAADSWFEQQGLKRNVAVSVPTFFMAQEYLRHSDMVAFMPSRLLPLNGLHEVPLTKYPPGFQVVAAYHPSVKADPFIIWLLACIKDKFSQ